MDVQDYLDIAYLPSLRRNKLHELDLYVPSNSPKLARPLICFIHGGAWRSEDKSDYALLARRLVIATGFTVAVPNYRLTTSSTPLQHPGHAEDVLAALSFLLSWHGPLPPGAHAPRLPYDRTRLFLVGHSCGAHIISSIVLDSSQVTPSLTPPATSYAVSHAPHLISSIRGVVFSEGIYDLDLLLSSFPEHKDWFIAPTFGHRTSYAPYSVTQYPFRPQKSISGHEGKHIRWLIIHSKGDTLVDVKQAEAMYQHLCNQHSVPAGEANSGDEPGATDGDLLYSKVTRNWDELSGDHDEILLGEQFVEVVRAFVEGDNA